MVFIVVVRLTNVWVCCPDVPMQCMIEQGMYATYCMTILGNERVHREDIIFTLSRYSIKVYNNDILVQEIISLSKCTS